jgi:hypothetical protein
MSFRLSVISYQFSDGATALMGRFGGEPAFF